MISLRPLDELRPEDLWKEVRPEPDEFWNDAREKQQRLLSLLHRLPVICLFCLIAIFTLRSIERKRQSG